MLSVKRWSVITTVALVLGLQLVDPANASCLNSSVDTRLRTFCVTEVLKNSAVTFGEANLLDVLLKREGYENGLGLPEPFIKTYRQHYFLPSLAYSSNINGGNADRLLVLGNYTFKGDPQYAKKSGVVLGFATGVNGRHIYGEEKYLDFSAAVSYAHSPDHDIGIGRASAGLCSRNLVRDHWYVDICAESSRLVRDLDDESTSGLTLSAIKLFSTNGSAFHSANLSVRRRFSEAYEQEQVLVGLSTARNNGIYTAFSLSLGERVEDQLVERRGAQAVVGANLFNRPVTATFGYTYSDGGFLLGFERSDTSISLNVSYAVTPQVSVSLGYRQTESSIEYFSESEPTFALQIQPIRF